ncbi:MAG TPA: SDR family oxidoreductase [Actinophytocola sp.]|uniref:SDR family NAD(P)-dependent oxidoreductase n=1 Tax=Actinophytocola sp. TaxID=1872138 RepID=UPI002F91F8C1
MSRLVVITGGTKGIGAAISRRFADAGDKVVALGRADLDVTDEVAVGHVLGSLGEIDVLVNNAGIATSAPVHRTTVEDWQAQLEVNATGAFLCTRAVLPGMRERDRGRIVTVASTAAHVGQLYTAGYTASKHAAVGLMRTVAAEVAGSGVTANAVCPTFVRTDMTTRTIRRVAEATGQSEEDSETSIARLSPLGRLLEPDEVAFAVAFLAAPEAGAINGQTIVLDGGGIQA